jgi:DNA helicase-2/ATP-dependent DNA helicase PcrA
MGLSKRPPMPQTQDSAALPGWLEELNPDQRRAVTHGDGPLLVVAGAGSGKTKTLAYRVAYLISRGVAPGRILLLTFTRRAAEEMLRRAALIVQRGAAVTGRVWGGTFHATANRLLRLYARQAGLPPDFTVMDESDAEDMINVVRHELGLGKQDKRFPRKATCLAIYSRCVNGAERLETVLQKHFPWCLEWKEPLKQLFVRYAARKRERGVLDYDDLLLYWQQLLGDEALAREIGGRFDHVLVDEYQDTNVVQAGILLGLRRFNHNIMVVGDDAQSIYSFRAATVRNILDFPKQFPGTTQVTLEQNYRSVMPILETTNRLIAQARERYTKDLWSARREGQRPRLVTCRDEGRQDAYVVARVLEHYEQGVPLRQQAVLFRAGHLSDSLEIELTRHNIPYHKYGGLRFLEAAHVKDLVSFLRIAENPRDEMAWFRVLQLIEGVGPATAARVIRHVGEHRDDPRAVRRFAAPPAATAGFAALAGLLDDLVAAGTAAPAAQVQRIRAYYEPLLERHYENPAMRRRDLEHIEQIASGYRSRRQFLTDLMLDPPTSTSDLAGPPLKDEDWLVLSTIHSAKGCEWDVVYVIHVSDGCLPSDMAAGSAEEIEEELRLTYVAMTRARNFLYLTWPLRYYHRWSSFTDRHVYAQMSRFLTDEVVASCERAEAGGETEADAAGEPPAGVSDGLRRRLESMWE